MSDLVSPNEMMAKAKEMMLDGREPESHEDWTRIVAFIGYNTPMEVAEIVALIMRAIYDIPLSPRHVKELAYESALQRWRDEALLN